MLITMRKVKNEKPKNSFPLTSGFCFFKLKNQKCTRGEFILDEEAKHLKLEKLKMKVRNGSSKHHKLNVHQFN